MKKQIAIFSITVMISSFLPQAVFATEKEKKEQPPAIETTIPDEVQTSSTEIRNEMATIYGLATHPRQNEIRTLLRDHLFDGIYTDIKLDEKMTRGLFIAVLCKVNRQVDLTGNPNPFKDVSSDDYYYDAVTWAAAHKIVKGKTATNFAPNEPITRQEMAFITNKFIKFFGFPINKVEVGTFKDQSKISSWALKSVAEVKSYGLIFGYEGQLFSPSKKLTTADGLVVIARLNEKVKEKYRP